MLLASQPLGSRRLAQLTGLADGTRARTLVRTLNRLYDSEGSAFRVEEVAGGLQLMTRAQFAPWLRRLHAVPIEVRLSPPAIETLAVVAYRQPVLRTEIEAIRGVQCGEILRQLIERDLVRIAGRSEQLGRPLLYGTTRLFLQVFGLRHLEELPRQGLFRSSKPAGDGAAADKEITALHNQSHAAGEETNVKALAQHNSIADELQDRDPTTIAPPLQPVGNGLAAMSPEFDEEEEDDDIDEDEDLDEDEDEDEEYEDNYDEESDDEAEEEEEEDEDEDIEDEPWEEVEDEDEDFEDEDDEEDEDWDDDEDEDWEDEDWEDEDEDEDEKEEEPGEAEE